MRNLIVLGLALFLLFALVKLPAALIRLVTDNFPSIEMTSISGTLWNGNGDVIVQGHPIGSLHWSINTAALLSAKVSASYTLTGYGADLSGDIAVGFGARQLTLLGTVSSNLINLYLKPYDLRIDGDFRLDDVQVTIQGDVVDSLDGQVHWSGGEVAYILAGTRSDARLPPLIARLENAIAPATPGARVYEVDGQVPLLIFQVSQAGFVKIGITKLLTKRLNTPWEGADPDDGVVLEVEEQLF